MAPEVKFSEKLEVVTKEIVICKLLTSNDLKVRKRGIVSLKKWFREIGQKEIIDEDDFNRIWNGLFYYVWMSDKPLVQEEATESISGMIHLIENYESAMYFIRGFFVALVKQWDRISHYRIDKFLMFVRRFLRQILVLLENHEWNAEKLDIFSRELYTAIQILPYSVALHLNEIFNEEVAKVSKGKIPSDSLVLLLKGYIECIANLRPTMQIVNSINSNVFGGLVRQLKLYIKQKALADDGDFENGTSSEYGDENEENEGALDPRPGGVDVFLPYIDFDENVVIDFIDRYRSKPGLPLKAKNIMTQMIDMFKSISRLRVSVSDPVKLLHEIGSENPKKRKKNSEKLSRLIKKSCKRLELEAEMEDEEDEKILKKLQNMTDIIQIPAGKSTFTVFRAKDDEKPKRPSTSNDWIVTEVPPKSDGGKKIEVDHDNDDVSNDDKIENVDEHESRISDHKKSPKLEKRIEVEPKRSSNNWIVTEEPTKTDSDQIFEEPDHGTDVINDEKEPIEVNKSKSLESEDEESKKLHDSIEVMEIPADNSIKENKKVSKYSISFAEKPTLINYDKDETESKTEDDDVIESEIIVPTSSIKNRPSLLKEEANYLLVNFNSGNADRNDEKFIVSEIKAQSVDEKPVAIKTRATRAKKSKAKIDTEDIAEEISPIRTRSHKRKPMEPIVSIEPLQIKTPVKSKKPPEYEKITESVGRKSLRIAERQKKVQFKLEDNAFQDISTYQKFVKSKPEIPFDGSKIPSTSILKPSPVSSPINPFYYSNGERKLRRRKK